jgi:hypothetical protein
MSEDAPNGVWGDLVSKAAAAFLYSADRAAHSRPALTRATDAGSVHRFRKMPLAEPLICNQRTPVVRETQLHPTAQACAAGTPATVGVAIRDRGKPVPKRDGRGAHGAPRVAERGRRSRFSATSDRSVGSNNGCSLVALIVSRFAASALRSDKTSIRGLKPATTYCT